MAKPTRRTFMAASAAAVTAGLAGPADASGHRGDPELRAMLREIDPKRIEAIIQRLVGFGTRHTLSAQDDPVRGIGAARDWILAEMQGHAARSGGRMTVALDSFIQPVANRIPAPTRITNVVAI